VRKFINAFMDREALVLLFRNDDGQLMKKVVDAQHVAYFKLAEMDAQLRAELFRSGDVIGAAEEGAWLRVTFKPGYWNARVKNKWTGKQGMWCSLREERCKEWEKKYGVKSYEADVAPLRRLFADEGHGIARPKRCYLDLETDSRASFPTVKSGRARILCWAVVGEGGELHSGLLNEDTDEDEIRLLTEMWNALDAYDQVCAWNGEGFDFPVAKERTKYLEVPVKDVRRWLYLDHLAAFKRYNLMSAESGEEKQNFKLETIAQAVLGEGKTEGMDGSKTWEYWEAGGESRAKLLKYNEQDTDLLRRIEEKTGYLELFQTLCEVCSVFPDSRGLKPTVQMDGYMLRLGVEKKVHFGTKWFGEETEQTQFRGAFVMEPQGDGILANVHVCDFASLYPSIMITWNLSPDTKLLVDTVFDPLTECHSPSTNVVTDGTLQGILATALLDMMALRAEWNKKRAACAPGTPEAKDAERRTNAYKTAANAFYGVMGTIFARYYDREISESTTQNGVWLIKKTMAECEKRGWFVVYGDTDSVFVTGCTKEEFEEFVTYCNDVLYPDLMKGFGCRVNNIKLAYEKEFDWIVFTSAKRYCNPPEAPIMMADFSFKPLGEIQVGDEVIGWERGRGTGRRKYVKSTVVNVQRHDAPIVKVTTAGHRTIRCTADHRWLAARSRTNSQYTVAKVGRPLAFVMSECPSVPPALATEASWLGGIWDGEGSLASNNRGQLVISQSRRVNPEVCDRIERACVQLGFRYGNWAEGDDGMRRYAIQGGMQEKLRFLRWCQPAKKERIRNILLKSRFATWADPVTRIEADGSGEVIGLTTTTGNYIAWGYASKNCGQYAHYKGTAATANSKPEIKGLEYKRGDVNRTARQMQGEVIDLLVKKKLRDPEGFVELIERYKNTILNEPLPIDQIVVTKAISKELEEYVTNKKLDGTDSAAMAHVQIARILLERGQDIGVGSRVGYVVMDASTSPMHVIPAEDFTGECDRFYLWENLIYPATQRLLQAAFPKYDWTKWERVRPVKPRLKRSQVADPPQMGLFGEASSPACEIDTQASLCVSGAPMVAATKRRQVLPRWEGTITVKGTGS
jgi:DNA polymerase elongation subunit (family B)